MKEDPKYICTECKSDLEKLISAGGGLIFKGMGFYASEKRMEEAAIESNTPRKERRQEVWDSMAVWERKVIKAEQAKQEKRYQKKNE